MFVVVKTTDRTQRPDQFSPPHLVMSACAVCERCHICLLLSNLKLSLVRCFCALIAVVVELWSDAFSVSHFLYHRVPSRSSRTNVNQRPRTAIGVGVRTRPVPVPAPEQQQQQQQAQRGGHDGADDAHGASAAAAVAGFVPTRPIGGACA